MIDRRRSSRVTVSFPVECKALPSQNYFYTVSKDISSVGVKILTNDFLSKGDSLQLHINLIDRLISLKAKVVWCNNERTSDRYAAGLEFMETNNQTKQSLSRFIDAIHNS